MATTPGGTTYALVDRIHDGKLADRLKEWRSEQPPASYDDISRRLEVDGVKVSRETVGRWVRDLGLVEVPS